MICTKITEANRPVGFMRDDQQRWLATDRDVIDMGSWVRRERRDRCGVAWLPIARLLPGSALTLQYLS